MRIPEIEALTVDYCRYLREGASIEEVAIGKR
jgi:hypothetical protein